MTVSIKIKIISFFAVFTVVLVSLISIILFVQKGNIEQEAKHTTAVLNTQAAETAERDLKRLTATIAEQVATVEEEIDHVMLNAAYVLQQADKNGVLTLAELEALKVQTGMNDLYITNEEGIFIEPTTEREAVGMSLFDIWDGYRMLMTGESTYLPSTLKIKVETGEIFKFTAIPRAGGNGIIQSALAADSVEEMLAKFFEQDYALQSLYLFDSENVVLTENLLSGTASKFTKGEVAAEQSITDIFNGNEAMVTMNDNIAEVYTPVYVDGDVRYTMYASIETTQYFAASKQTKEALQTIEGAIQGAIVQTIIISIIISVVLLTVLSVLVTQQFKPLHTFAEKLRTRGSTTEDMDVNERELVEIQQAVNDVNRQYNDILLSVQANTAAVTQAQRDYLVEMSTTKQTLAQVSEAVRFTAENTQQQAEQVVQAETHVGHNTDVLQQVLSQADMLAKFSEESKTATLRSIDGIDTLSRTIDTISCEVLENSNRVNVLLNSSKQISAIIQMIKSIADNTNLLALNASIEAARAGENGKGFAVVADEVRKLAEQSAGATHQISDILLELQEEIEQAKHSNDAQTATINVTKDEMQHAREAIEQLIDNTERSRDKILSLASLVESLKGINKEENEIFHVLTSSIQNNAANSQELLSMIDDVDNSVQHLNSMLDRLVEHTSALERVL